ncbi:O-methyltransferase [Salmonirosea aquatica]|uniref:Methyltransferase domain-containing protein n=1 Tax=Salmonirosea aquatica TaxID=2654236 RepID=A0A7C9FP71_9BACT|nr:methyltransferase domain-containing protein [Cytophagaceae bacterium SJW1-29]
MEFIPKEIEAYAEAHSEPESDLLRRLNRDTHAKVMRPRMLSGHLQGRLLALFSRLVRPQQILEIGTYTGYSALCLCEGLAENGKLITIDSNEELEGFAKETFSKSEYCAQIDFRIGKALDILPTLTGPFDLVFIDADKVNYARYYDMILDKLRPGGIILADNVLWSGKVVDESATQSDRDTQALLMFNKKIREDARVKCLLLPVRDGIMVAQKI